MRRVSLCLFMFMLVFATGVMARGHGTPDGQPPSIETVCDSLRGTNAFGLCNAYCEAMDCDSPNPHASASACSNVLANFQKKTHGGTPPCSLSCPCTELLPVFGSFVNGPTQIDTCTNDSNNILEQTGTDENDDTLLASVIRSFGEAGISVCRTIDANGQERLLEIERRQVDPCIQVLTNAAAGQNVICEGGGA